MPCTLCGGRDWCRVRPPDIQSESYRRLRGNSNSSGKLHFLTSFPQRTPQVSMPLAVLALASWRNSEHKLRGTTMWRKPSMVGTEMDKKEKSEAIGPGVPEQKSELTAWRRNATSPGFPPCAPLFQDAKSEFFRELHRQAVWDPAG